MRVYFLGDHVVKDISPEGRFPRMMEQLFHSNSFFRYRYFIEEDKPSSLMEYYQNRQLLTKELHAAHRVYYLAGRHDELVGRGPARREYFADLMAEYWNGVKSVGARFMWIDTAGIESLNREEYKRLGLVMVPLGLWNEEVGS